MVNVMGWVLRVVQVWWTQTSWWKFKVTSDRNKKVMWCCVRRKTAVKLTRWSYPLRHDSWRMTDKNNKLAVDVTRKLPMRWMWNAWKRKRNWELVLIAHRLSVVVHVVMLCTMQSVTIGSVKWSNVLTVSVICVRHINGREPQHFIVLTRVWESTYRAMRMCTRCWRHTTNDKKRCSMSVERRQRSRGGETTRNISWRNWTWWHVMCCFQETVPSDAESRLERIDYKSSSTSEYSWYHSTGSNNDVISGISQTSSVLYHLSLPQHRFNTNEGYDFTESVHSCSLESTIYISNSSDFDFYLSDIVDRAMAFVTNAELERVTEPNIVVYVSEDIARFMGMPFEGDGHYVAPSNILIDVSVQTAISSLTARYKSNWWRYSISAKVKDALLLEYGDEEKD